MLHFLLASSFLAVCASSAGIEQVRLTPLGTGVRVTFVVLGTPGEGNGTVTISPSTSAPAVPRTYTDGGWEGMIYSADFPSVSGCFSYKASLGSEESAMFHGCTPTKPSASQYPFRIAAVADIGAPSVRGSPGVSNWTIDALNAAGVGGGVDLGLITGDIAYIDRNTSDVVGVLEGGAWEGGGSAGLGRQDDEAIYDLFFEALEPFLSSVPTLTAVGNHEAPGTPPFIGYLTRLGADMPNAGKGSGGLWHWSVFGRVGVVTLSTEHNYSVGSLQHSWAVEVVGEMQARKQRGELDWVVAQMHRCFYTSTDDYYDRVVVAQRLRDAFEQLFRTGTMDPSTGWDPQANGPVVDLLLSGHLHNAEQFLPAFNKTPTNPSFHKPSATVQLIIGNAGDQEGLTNSWTDPWSFSILRKAQLGFANITAHNASTLQVDSVFVANQTSHKTTKNTFYIQK